MGTALETVGATITNPGTTVTNAAASSGDSLTVRSFDFASGAFLEALAAKSSTAGVVRVTSPRLHDQVQGIRYQFKTSDNRNLMCEYASQRLFPQDDLTVALSGAAAAEATSMLTLYYNDLPGVSSRLAMWEQVQARIVNVLTQEVNVDAITTAGEWSAGTAIDSDFDLLKANVDYAVLGFVADTERIAYAIRGSDTGNLRVGAPGIDDEGETRSWFVNQSLKTGRAHIPVINAANKSSTLVFQLDDTAAAAVDLGLVLAELSAG